jgi:PncC family amidohydrolase
VAYADAVKRQTLSVPASMLASHGAVSDAVAKAMAQGVRERLGADIGLAVTGIAGPAGAVRGKPVGTVWIAISDRSATLAVRRQFHGDRLAVKQQTAQIALGWLRRWVSGDRSL